MDAVTTASPTKMAAIDVNTCVRDRRFVAEYAAIAPPTTSTTAITWSFPRAAATDSEHTSVTTIAVRAS